MFQAIGYWHGNALLLSVIILRKRLRGGVDGGGLWERQREGREGEREMSVTETTRY